MTDNFFETNNLPSVSIIMPCYNERTCIEQSLASVIENDYPNSKMEIFVIDGMSNDGTRDILNEIVAKYSFITVLDNPKKSIPVALNIGIRQAGGEIVVRMDAHSIYVSNYLKECIRSLREYTADNVGGRWITVPRENSFLGRAICFASSTPFGVGNAYYRLTKLLSMDSFLQQPRWGITVAYFCCRREIFDMIGLFNEHIDRSEDIDFHRRLRVGGLRTLFVPSIACYYQMRTKFPTFLKHIFKNGQWILLPLNYSPHISFSLRHAVPLISVLTFLTFAVLAGSGAIYPLFVFISLYSSLALFFSFCIALRERDPRYFFILPFIFLCLHTVYGLGSLSGPLCMLSDRFKIQ